MPDDMPPDAEKEAHEGLRKVFPNMDENEPSPDFESAMPQGMQFVEMFGNGEKPDMRQIMGLIRNAIGKRATLPVDQMRAALDTVWAAYGDPTRREWLHPGVTCSFGPAVEHSEITPVAKFIRWLDPLKPYDSAIIQHLATETPNVGNPDCIIMVIRHANKAEFHVCDSGFLVPYMEPVPEQPRHATDPEPMDKPY